LDWIEQYEREHADSERDPQRLRERANQEFERRSIRIIEARSKKAAERKANWEKTEKLEEMPDEKKE
jgi:hypothetical protein